EAAKFLLGGGGEQRLRRRAPFFNEGGFGHGFILARSKRCPPWRRPKQDLPRGTSLSHISPTPALPLEGGGDPAGRARAPAPAPLEGEGWGGGYYRYQTCDDRERPLRVLSCRLRRAPG